MFTQAGYGATFSQEHFYNVKRKRERNYETGSEMNISVAILSLVQNTYRIGNQRQVRFSGWEKSLPVSSQVSFFRLGKQVYIFRSDGKGGVCFLVPPSHSLLLCLACPLSCLLNCTPFLHRHVEMIESGRPPNPGNPSGVAIIEGIIIMV